MIISPPYLLPRNANETEEAWIHRCMAGGDAGDGAYPLSSAMQWHGGLHLREPEANAPVRAIADGDVVFLRRPTEQPAGALPPDHAQAYRGGWTDNGVLVLRHQTDIGEGANASVTFFSIYMHLREIESAIQPNRRVYRKAPLGRAGQVYGNTGRLHFEIVCDDANLQRLVGRASGNLTTSANGRTDAVYGSMHFRLPAGTLVYPAETRPALNVAQAAGGTALAAEVFVELRYASGEGAAGNRGDAYLSTYQPDGTRIGQPLEENDAEYNLYRDANAISNAYPANARPAPSAVYELLRFGRVIGPDALNPATVPHWRRIHYPGGTGWVNLNAANVTKFSDADFPHWIGWSLVDDSADLDSRCDSATIKAWLDTNSDGKVTPAEALARMGTDTVAPKLAKAICKFPTEWNAASIDRRLGWIKTSTAENPNPVDAANFERLRAHVAALAFWPGNTGLPESHWHWNPRAFIAQFRKCGWLSVNELAQCLPRRSLSNNSLSWNTAHARAQNHSLALNKYFRKYKDSSRQRHIHALAQIYIEVDLLNTLSEYGRGRTYSYGPFYGRGYNQLTWASNYDKYGKFKSIPNHVGAYSDARITSTSIHAIDSSGSTMKWAPRYDPAIIETDPNHASDSSGFYWVSKTFRRTNNINRVCDLGVSPTEVGFISWLINGGSNGYINRQQFALYLINILLDEPTKIGSERFTFPALSPAGNPSLCRTFPPTPTSYTLHENIHYDHQRP